MIPQRSSQVNLDNYPQLFVQSPDPRTSHRYRLVSTIAVINYLRNYGWDVVDVAATKTKDGRITGRHYVSLENTKKDLSFGDSKLRILLSNSHDGRHSLRMNLGIYRFVCANGLVVGNNFYQSKPFVHLNSVHDYLDEFLGEVNDAFEELISKISLWKNTEISCASSKQTRSLFSILASNLCAIRNIELCQVSLLYPKRVEDYGWDLWTLMNIAQEKLINGGFTYSNKHNRKLRPITSPGQKERLNQQIWNVVEDFANTYIK